MFLPWELPSGGVRRLHLICHKFSPGLHVFSQLPADYVMTLASKIHFFNGPDTLSVNPHLLIL